MFPPFPEDGAYEVCRKIAEDLDSGRLILRQVTKLSLERAGQGIMLGAAICKDSSGQKVILKTVSGIARKLTFPDFSPLPTSGSEIYVLPLISPAQIESALAKNDDAVHALTAKIGEAENSFDMEKVKSLKKERTLLTNESLKKVHDLYSFTKIDKSKISLNEICRMRLGGKNPPTGTGDCCAPKLLEYAFTHDLTILSMCEIFYGRKTANKISGQKYPPCDERCGIILPVMLGLEVIYRDSSICVINKESGLLSIPGRTADKQDCVTSRFKRLYPDFVGVDLPAVHRLDMETSGLMLLAFTKDAQKNLNRQFELGESIHKEYTALIDGILPARKIPIEGEMTLFHRVDLDNRPHQIYDEIHGKKAVTKWKIQDVETYISPDGSRRKVTRVTFFPQTGRTHQLRFAAADSHGWACPIVGDTLYGRCEKGERLKLHASRLEFNHPDDGRRMIFESKAPF